jgi:hypothetical protein
VLYLQPIKHYSVMNKIVSLLKQAWAWLDGKKTNIGAAIATFIGLIQGFNAVVLIGIWHCAGIPDLSQICLTLGWAAALFGGTGLIHQAAKNMPSNNNTTSDQLKDKDGSIIK